MRKDILIFAFIFLFGVILFSGTKIQSVEEYYTTHIDDISSDSDTVTLEISATQLLDQMDQLDEALQDEKYVPENGLILPEKTYVLRKDDTVFDLLKRVTRYEEIQMEYQAADENIFDSAYIQGINHLYEFSAGPLSGWVYTVNGKIPDVGVSRYHLSNHDKITFQYTLDLGRDIEQINERKN